MAFDEGVMAACSSVVAVGANKMNWYWVQDEVTKGDFSFLILTSAEKKANV